MRKPFDLNKTELDRATVLLYGAYGAGKTHLMGDFLRWATMQGQVRFINVQGEDGAASIAGMGLGAIAETVETLKDYSEAIAEYRSKGLAGLGIDSMSAIYRLVLIDVVGEPRYPDAVKDGERSRMYWGQISLKMENAILDSKTAAPLALWVAPIDRSVDPVTGGQSGRTPNLPGKLAWGCGGWFDFVGELKADTKPGNVVVRSVSFSPEAGRLTRQRAPRLIAGDIQIPADGGGWEAVYTRIQRAFEAPQKPKEA